MLDAGNATLLLQDGQAVTMVADLTTVYKGIIFMMQTKGGTQV